MVALTDDNLSAAKFHLGYGTFGLPAHFLADFLSKAGNIPDIYIYNLIVAQIVRCDTAYADTLYASTSYVDTDRVAVTGDVTRTTVDSEKPDFYERNEFYLLECDRLAFSLGVSNLRRGGLPAVDTSSLTINTIPGPQGETGATGPVSYPGLYAYSDAVEAGTVAGTFRFDNLTLASVTGAWLNDTGSGSVDLEDLLGAVTQDSILAFVSAANPTTKFAYYQVSAIADLTGEYDFTVSHLASAGSFTDTESISVIFLLAGPQGIQGIQGIQGDPGPQGPVGPGISFVGNWIAQAYSQNEAVFYSGGNWVASEATASGDVPGVSSKWSQLILGDPNQDLILKGLLVR